jgi:anti-anti-sigma regulatory factor
MQALRGLRVSVVTQPAGSICSVPLVEVRITGALEAARLSITGGVLDTALRLRPACVVVDLAECSGIDAAAIDMLLEVHRELSRAGSQLTLRAPTPRLRRILGIARVDHVLHTVPGPGTGQSNERLPNAGDDTVSTQPVPDPLAGAAHRHPAVPNLGTPPPHASER